MDSFDEFKKELIEKYLKDDTVHDLDLTYTLENNNKKLKKKKYLKLINTEVLRK